MVRVAMKWFALLGVLCAHALARDESNKLLDATATSTGATGNKILKDRTRKRDSIFGPLPKNGFAREASAVVVITTPPSQSNGASIMSRCSGTTEDEIPVGLLAILAKNGAEYVYLPISADIQTACFESYNNTNLIASDLVSCCDAAAKGKFNSFRFDGGLCTGFIAWLSPIDTECYEDYITGPGLYVAKEKLSNFTAIAPTFSASSSLKLARIEVEVTEVEDGCPYAKTLKITTYSKNKTVRLDFTLSDGYTTEIYLPEVCDDAASEDKRTVTVSILDWDGSVLASATEVTTSRFTGRHLLTNGVCVIYSGSRLLKEGDASLECENYLHSRVAFEDGLLSFAYLRQELVRLNVTVLDFWTEAVLYRRIWIWYNSEIKVNMSLFNIPSLQNPERPFQFSVIMNATDWQLYIVASSARLSTLCIDAPYY